MSGRAGVVNGSSGHTVLDPEPASDACPASICENPKMTDWPLRSCLELGALPSAVSCARLHAKHMLWEWRLEDFTDSVEVVVSELVTNAITAAGSLEGSRFDGRWRPGTPPVRLSLYSDRKRVLIQVWDGDHHMPEVRADDPLAESGRGLLLVATLSAEWGTYALEGASGKVVWAIL